MLNGSGKIFSDFFSKFSSSLKGPKFGFGFGFRPKFEFEFGSRVGSKFAGAGGSFFIFSNSFGSRKKIEVLFLNPPGGRTVGPILRSPISPMISGLKKCKNLNLGPYSKGLFKS